MDRRRRIVGFSAWDEKCVEVAVLLRERQHDDVTKTCVMSRQDSRRVDVGGVATVVLAVFHDVCGSELRFIPVRHSPCTPLGFFAPTRSSAEQIPVPA